MTHKNTCDMSPHSSLGWQVARKHGGCVRTPGSKSQCQDLSLNSSGLLGFISDNRVFVELKNNVVIPLWTMHFFCIITLRQKVNAFLS